MREAIRNNRNDRMRMTPEGDILPYYKNYTVNSRFFYLTEKSMAEFSKDIYSDEVLSERLGHPVTANIQGKARNGTLSLCDVFETLQDRFDLRVSAFGTDVKTGTRKYYDSKKYTSADIVSGFICGA